MNPVDQRYRTLELGPRARILILRVDRIGDVLISQPFLRALHCGLPDASVSVLLGKRNASMRDFVLRHAQRVFVYRKSVVEILKLLIVLRRERFDVVVDMQDNPSRTSALLMKWCGARFKLGFDKSNREQYTHLVPLADRTQVPMVELMASLLAAFGVSVNSSDLFLECPGVENTTLAQKEQASNTAFESVDFFLHLSAGKESMRWPKQRWVQLIQLLQHALPACRILLGSDAGDAELRHVIASETSAQELSNQADIAAYARQLRCARIMISPDTSVVHIAASLKIPSVVLYAKPHSDRAPWYPYQCDYRACISKDAEGIHGIEAQEVSTKAVALWAQYCAQT